MMMDLAKREQLDVCLTRLAQKDCLLAFSGGADSALLLVLLSRACQKAGTRLVAIHINTELSPNEDLELARSFAQKMNVSFEALHLNEWLNPEIVANGRDRCYHCKKLLFSTLKDFAQKRNIEHVIDGTNHDDLGQYRPGLKAIKELGIFSPLAYSGVTKAEVRSLLEELGLEVAHRPSSPCLATRFPYGRMLDRNWMQKIDKAERFIKDMGFFNVRVRLHESTARIEVDKTDVSRLFQKREIVTSELKSLGFTHISIDLEGFRSGSMDVAQGS